MQLRWIGLSLLSLSLVAGSPQKAKAAGIAPAAPVVGAQDPWDEPPGEFREVQRKGFHDGVEGARKDWENHRHPDPDDRDEYKHPHVPKSERMDYREGYRRGYERAMEHLMHEHSPDHY